MARDHTTDIEQAVRDVLSEVLSGISEERGTSESGRGMGVKARASQPGRAQPPEQDTDTPDVSPEVLSAVEELCSQLSAEQAGALASLFEAIADQSEEEPEEPEEGDEGIEAKAFSALELSSEEDARAEGQRISAKGSRIDAILKLLKKSKPLLLAAVRAAKRGRNAFMKWTNSLSNFNPVKWAIKAAPPVVISELIDRLTDLTLSRAAR
jgi:hypothetical protein